MQKIEALKGVISNRGGRHHSIVSFLRIGMRVMGLLLGQFCENREVIDWFLVLTIGFEGDRQANRWTDKSNQK